MHRSKMNQYMPKGGGGWGHVEKEEEEKGFLLSLEDWEAEDAFCGGSTLFSKSNLPFHLFLVGQCHKVTCKQISRALETSEFNLEIMNKCFLDFVHLLSVRKQCNHSLIDLDFFLIRAEMAIY